MTIARKGAVDAAFTPSSLEVSLGSNPLIFTADAVISVATSVPPEGTPFLLANDSSLYISDGVNLTGNIPPVTGLRVAEGVTVTLDLNFPSLSSLAVTGDIENHGTITTKDISSLQCGHLELSASQYLGSGTIDTSAHIEGQSGGNISLQTSGDIIQGGQILTTGNSTNGELAGAGGTVEIYAGAVLENTGSIDTHGGNAVNGAGGQGGYIDLVGYYGLRNDGRLTSTGGSGVMEGGSGGWIWMEVYTEGDLRSAGAIDSSGGDSSGGSGGPGGDIDIYAYGGSLRHNADCNSGGGSSQASDGGPGGYILISTFQGWNVDTPPGDILVSGNLTSTGGSAGPAGSGGDGGSIDFYIGNYAEENPALEQNQRLALLGYRVIDTRGGGGNFGGSGGEVDLVSDHGYVNPGLLTNEADMVTRGGSVASGPVILPAYGGKGGNVYIETYADPTNTSNPLGTKVNNAGAIDAGGGEGMESDSQYWWAGSGGEVMFYGAEALTNSGDIAVCGGDDRGTDGAGGFGGEGNWITLIADGPLCNSGMLDAGGGNGQYRGGSAGEISIVGIQSVFNSGDIYARGGDAQISVFGSWGGDGGLVDIGLLTGTGEVNNTGSVFVQGGSGSTPGIDGSFVE